MGLPSNGSVDTVAADNGSFATRQSAIRGDLEQSGLPELGKFITALIFIRNISIIIAVLVIVLIFPLYPILKSLGYSTHQDNYGWLLSAGYISGIVPSLVFLGLYIFVCVVFLLLVETGYSSLFSSKPSVFLIHGFKDLFQNDHPAASLLKSSMALFVNFGVVLGSAFAYVIILISNYHYVFKASMQLLFSFFRVLWNSVGVPTCFSAMKSMNHKAKVLLYVFTLCFNNVISLVIAAALSDPSCFGDIFYEDQYDEVKYAVFECIKYIPFLDFCRERTIVIYSSRFSTPLIYNYLCGSAIIRSFVPIMFYVYGAMLFLFPLMFYLMAKVEKNRIPKTLRHYIPTILWPDECVIGNEKVFRPNNVMNSQLGHLVVLLTFGVMYPPLGLAIALTITAITSMWIIIIGRFAERNLVLDRKLLSSSELFKFDSLFNDVWASIQHSKWLIFFISGIFCACSLFDMAGDQESPLTATLIVLSFVGFLFITFFGNKLMDFPFFRKYICAQNSRDFFNHFSEYLLKLLLAMELPFNPSLRALREMRGGSEISGEWIAANPSLCIAQDIAKRSTVHARATSTSYGPHAFKYLYNTPKADALLDDGLLHEGLQMQDTRPL
jgi:hypothetical protein